MDKNETMSMLNCSISSDLTIGEVTTSTSSDFTIGSGCGYHTCWDYYQNCYYPYVIRESYPVYIQEKALDKGKQAFEIIKILKDKRLVQLKKVSDFIDLMDALIKIL